MTQGPDYYAALGVSRNASQEEIKQAYHEAAQRLHPDKNIADGETEIFLDVQQAYETLSNPNRRKKYDAILPPEEEPDLPVKYKIYYSRPNLVRLERTTNVVCAARNFSAEKKRRNSRSTTKCLPGARPFHIHEG